MSVVHLASNVALLAFALASVLYLVAVQQRGAATPWSARVAFGLFVFGTVAVSVAVATVVQDASLLEMSGLLLTSAIAWLAIGGHLQFNMRLIGAFVAPLATLILLIQAFVISVAPPGVPHLQGGGLLVAVHVAMAVVGEAFAILACAVSIFYLWQQNLLKKKRLSQLPQSLPAIDKIDFVLRLSLWTGFVFLTFGLLSGAVYTQLYAPPEKMQLSAKIVWAAAVWLWYLLILLAKNVFNRPSKRIAQMSLAGFMLLALSYFGMVFVTGGR